MTKKMKAYASFDAYLAGQKDQTGYQAAYAAHQDLTKRHIAELKKPRIGLGPVAGILGAAGVGIVAGRLLP